MVWHIELVGHSFSSFHFFEEEQIFFKFQLRKVSKYCREKENSINVLGEDRNIINAIVFYTVVLVVLVVGVVERGVMIVVMGDGNDRVFLDTTTL